MLCNVKTGAASALRVERDRMAEPSYALVDAVARAIAGADGYDEADAHHVVLARAAVKAVNAYKPPACRQCGHAVGSCATVGDPCPWRRNQASS